ncbi:MAG: hypothetical protein PHD00_08800 [Bacteroidales bacterium]|jgi:DNA-binding CsgD family transcriptional regulator|nr:hypothetical protein [Bacteroidales bacterium]MDD4672818.1 hypothetical protein [Bacteroidales bacterium]
MLSKGSIIFIVIFISLHFSFYSYGYGVERKKFDSLYTVGISKIRIDIRISDSCINKLNKIETLSFTQKAKLNYLKSKVHAQKVKNQPKGFVVQDDMVDPDSLLATGISYIEHGYASKGLEIIYNYIETNRNSIKDTLLDYLNIKIAEGLRMNLEYKKAVYILEEVLQSPKINSFNKSYAYNRLAAIYDVTPELSFQQRVDSVKKYSDLSISISKPHNFLYLLGLSQSELGSLYRLSSMNLDLSELYCTKAIQNFIEIKAYRNAMNTSIILSDIYIRRGELQKSTIPLYKVLDYLNVIGNEDMFMRVYLQLAKSHYLLKDYHNAYEFLSVGRLLEKLLFEFAMDEKISEMSAKYNLALKESEISKRENKIKLQRKDIRYLAAVLMITLTTLIISILYFSIKRKSLKQQHDLEILEKKNLQILFKAKNKELVQSLAHSIDKNNVLKTLKKEIAAGKSSNELTYIINSNIDTSHNWREILLNFQNLYPDFFSKLSVQHPNLTQNEIKLCALLILKLSTNEISEVLSVSSSAISKSRQRLRKRLNLDKEADLHTYLQKFI